MWLENQRQRHQDHRRITVTDERGRPVRDNEGNRIYRYERMRAPVVRQYTVFNAEQADGLPGPGPRPLPSRSGRRTSRPRGCWKTAGSPSVTWPGDRAFYNLNRDEIVLPERVQFPSANHYYQTALHELGHSTGHPERMNSATLTQVSTPAENRTLLGVNPRGWTVGVGWIDRLRVSGCIHTLEFLRRPVAEGGVQASSIVYLLKEVGESVG